MRDPTRPPRWWSVSQLRDGCCSGDLMASSGWQTMGSKLSNGNCEWNTCPRPNEQATVSELLARGPSGPFESSSGIQTLLLIWCVNNVCFGCNKRLCYVMCYESIKLRFYSMIKVLHVNFNKFLIITKYCQSSTLPRHLCFTQFHHLIN